MLSSGQQLSLEACRKSGLPLQGIRSYHKANGIPTMLTTTPDKANNGMQTTQISKQLTNQAYAVFGFFSTVEQLLKKMPKLVLQLQS
ncbi:Phosphoglucosamine mutase [Trichinella pseudospiralis]